LAAGLGAAGFAFAPRAGGGGALSGSGGCAGDVGSAPQSAGLATTGGEGTGRVPLGGGFGGAAGGLNEKAGAEPDPGSGAVGALAEADSSGVGTCTAAWQ